MGRRLKEVRSLPTRASLETLTVGHGLTAPSRAAPHVLVSGAQHTTRCVAALKDNTEAATEARKALPGNAAREACACLF